MARTRRSGATLPYGALDRDHLVKHLLELARRVGVGQVTMRALATEAGTSASSVYYHVKDKSALLDLLVEAVLEGIEVPVAGDWTTRITVLHTEAWQAMAEIPGIAALLQQRPLAGMAHAMDNAARSILADAGLPPEELETAHAVLYIHLLGSVQLAHHLRAAHGGGALPQDAELLFQRGLRMILAGLAHDQRSTA